MSYVDLMGNTRWAEEQHVRHTEALVRRHWSPEDEAILNRKVVGALSGMNALTAQDQADIADFKAVTSAAQAAGAQGRADAARLHAALDYEEARAAMALLPSAPEDGSADPAADQRTQLQAQLDAATVETLTLVAQRDAARTPQEVQP